VLGQALAHLPVPRHAVEPYEVCVETTEVLHSAGCLQNLPRQRGQLLVYATAYVFLGLDDDFDSIFVLDDSELPELAS
jgi:hypothetical protein